MSQGPGVSRGEGKEQPLLGPLFMSGLYLPLLRCTLAGSQPFTYMPHNCFPSTRGGVLSTREQPSCRWCGVSLSLGLILQGPAWTLQCSSPSAEPSAQHRSGKKPWPQRSVIKNRGELAALLVDTDHLETGLKHQGTT